MYSIIIELGTNKFQFVLDAETSRPWSGNLEETKAKYLEVINDTPAGKVKVVHNTTIDMSLIDIVDVTDE